MKQRIRTCIGVLAAGAALSLGLGIAKLYVGLKSNSVCIMIDSTNSFFDTVTTLTALVAIALLFKPRSAKFPYGWGRGEYVSGELVAVVTVVMGVVFFLQSLNRLAMPEPVWFGWQSLVIVSVALVVKVGMAVGHLLFNRRLHSPVLKAITLDCFLDVGITTVSVVSVTVSPQVGYALDAWLGIAVSVVVAVFGLKAVWDNLLPLLGYGDLKAEKEAVREVVGEMGEITHEEWHDYGYRAKVGTITVAVDGDTDMSDVIADWQTTVQNNTGALVRFVIERKGVNHE